MDIIVNHDEFQKLDIMVPTYQKTGVLSERMESGMNNISRLVGDLISK
ncbi:hypothetical protein [Pseudoalteromonas sp. GB43]